MQLQRYVLLVGEKEGGNKYLMKITSKDIKTSKQVQKDCSRGTRKFYLPLLLSVFICLYILICISIISIYLYVSLFLPHNLYLSISLFIYIIVRTPFLCAHVEFEK